MLRSLVLCLAIFLSGCSQEEPAETNPDNTEAIKVLYESYRTAWLRNDARTEPLVLSLFTEDATIIPSGGEMIFTGQEEMKGFWFPPDAPPSTVDLFEQEVLAVSAGETQGMLLGRFKLKFSYETESYYTEGYNLLTMVRKEGQWRISTMMWNHPPWETPAGNVS